MCRMWSSLYEQGLVCCKAKYSSLTHAFLTLSLSLLHCLIFTPLSNKAETPQQIINRSLKKSSCRCSLCIYTMLFSVNGAFTAVQVIHVILWYSGRCWLLNYIGSIFSIRGCPVRDFQKEAMQTVLSFILFKCCPLYTEFLISWSLVTATVESRQEGSENDLQPFSMWFSCSTKWAVTAAIQRVQKGSVRLY